ncbi:hypothetical protein Pcinc_015232 [Petrolisthes cinctipes]|uniref:WAP domain-containing protein n=1 Tax=Petrolisthes cinctipes TaxID=88211 RepID=A0AAE1KQY5_PETCI|nr:hypothetical protein Pcinc_015232 [Petrolisthes cinctipes]
MALAVVCVWKYVSTRWRYEVSSVEVVVDLDIYIKRDVFLSSSHSPTRFLRATTTIQYSSTKMKIAQLLVVVTLMATTALAYPNPGGCPFFNLAAATFPVGQAPNPCYSDRDCFTGQLCCPAESSRTNLCLSPLLNNPFHWH